MVKSSSMQEAFKTAGTAGSLQGSNSVRMTLEHGSGSYQSKSPLGPLSGAALIFRNHGLKIKAFLLYLTQTWFK